MPAAFISDLTNCPLDNSPATNGGSSGGQNLTSSLHHYVASTLVQYLLQQHNNTPSHSSIVPTTPTPTSTSLPSSGNPQSFAYASTTILFGILALLCLVFAILILVFFHGVKLFTVLDDVQDPSTGRAMTIKKRKKADQATSNIWWAALYFTKVGQYCISVAVLQIHVFSNTIEAQRVAILVGRILLGLSAFLLVVALNHQRLYRHRDYSFSQVSANLRRQAKRMLYICAGLFFLFIGGEFVASHAIETDNTTRNVLFWVYIGALVALTFPTIFATAWVCFHNAQIEPTRSAKNILFIGIVIHIMSMFPSSFWNGKILYKFVRNDPCPLHFLSFYDLILILQMFGHLFVMLFVILEYRRNRQLLVTDEFLKYSENLNAVGFSSSTGYGAASLNTIHESESLSPSERTL